jgi:FkbM family methyltransferase
MPGLEDFRFWWSYVPIAMSNHPERPLLDYWGDDCGELRFLWRFLKPGMTLLDVGAHHGVFSLLSARKLAGAGKVIAFEPSPRERKRFELHARLNGIHGICLEPYAVSAAGNTLKFYTVSSGFTTMNSLKKPPVETPVREELVEAVSLDEYLGAQGITRVDVVKMDVEGGELEAFQGSQRMLSEFRPLIICEVLDWVTQPWGYAASRIVRHLREQRYCWFGFRDDGAIFPHAEQREYPETRNYLAVPEEKLSLVQEGQRA